MRALGFSAFALGANLCCPNLGGCANLWVAEAQAQAEESPAQAEESPAQPTAPETGEAPKASPVGPWCSPDLETLDHDVCYAKGPNKDPQRRTLVIFLHGLTEDGAGWQYNLQKGMTLAGKSLDFSVLVPRGRNGVGPGRKPSTIAWPLGEEPRRLYEQEVIKEWFDAKALIEKRENAAFNAVYVMGFSNGAYYASSLALRGRLDVEGYAVFAGGSAVSAAVGSSPKKRKPIFVGIATKDETAKKGKELAKALASLRWPHRVDSRPVGHVVADGQLRRALEYLRAPERQSRKVADARHAPQKKKPAAKHKASTETKKRKH